MNRLGKPYCDVVHVSAACRRRAKRILDDMTAWADARNAEREAGGAAMKTAAILVAIFTAVGVAIAAELAVEIFKSTHIPSTLEAIGLNIACIDPNVLPLQAKWECVMWQKIGRIPKTFQCRLDSISVEDAEVSRALRGSTAKGQDQATAMDW